MAHRAPLRMPLPICAAAALLVVSACGDNDSSRTDEAPPDPAVVAEGKQTFRFDTFGSERQWTDTLRLHEVIASAVDPVTALSVGLKVDSSALPSEVVQGIQDGTVDLKSPATTIALLKLDAVVGMKGTVETINGKDALTRVGVTCAICHSTVDDSFAAGIGKRLDGWPNRDLNPGAIIALSPSVPDPTKTIYNCWGKGKFDPRFRGHRLLESVRRSHTDGRRRIFLRPENRCQCHQRHPGSGHCKAARIAGLSADAGRTCSAARKLRSGSGSAARQYFPERAHVQPATAGRSSRTPTSACILLRTS